MNKYLLAIAGASLLSFSAFSSAADEIKHSDMEKYTKIGEVSAEVRDGTMDDIVKKLEKKAEEKMLMLIVSPLLALKAWEILPAAPLRFIRKSKLFYQPAAYRGRFPLSKLGVSAILIPKSF